MNPVSFPVKRHAWVTPAVVGLLLILRLVLLGLGGWLLSPAPAWLGPVYEAATYLLTLFLIWWERDRLGEYHIGRLAVGLILVFKPLQTLMLAFSGMDLPMAFPRLPALIVCAASAVMLGWIVLAKPGLRAAGPADWRWFGLGALAGVATAVVLAFPMAAQVRLAETQTGRISFVMILFALLRDFPYQLGYAAASEEPLFRGFLWGCLRRAGWKERWIWLFQAGLFMLSHVYYAARLPYSFWVIVPVAALVLGWLAWRSRSIATSMAAHAALNALGYLLGQVVARWLFR